MNVDAAEIERRLERFRVAAKAAGIKLTHQRLEIFRELAASLDHPSAEAVHQAVRARVPGVSLDTVYRTLWVLHDLGLIATLGPRRSSVRFDANLDHHHHYVCVRCGLARDFTSPALDALRVPAAVEGFGSITGTQVEVRGICRSCAQAEAGAPEKRSPNPPSGATRRGP